MTSTTSSTSTARGIALSVLVATVAGSLVNAVISVIAQAFGADATQIPGLMPAAYIVFTLVGTLAGAIGWAVIRARSAAPGALLRWLVPTVVVISLVPDLLVGLSLGWGVLGLALMHPAVAAVAVAAYRRFLPLAR